MKEKPLVSVVIPTYNRRKRVVNLVRSLLKGKYKNIEILVIDDASTDSTSEYLRTQFKKHSKIRIFRNSTNLFAAASKNIGQAKAKGELIAFIDDDNEADENLIQEMVKALFVVPDAGMVGPINYFMKKKKKVLLVSSKRNMWTTKTMHVRSLSGFGKGNYWEADDIPNAFMVRAEVIKKKNIFFRSKFGIMYEESDYAYRIKKAGYKIVYCRKARIYHDVEILDRDFITHFLNDPRRSFTFARNRLLFHAIYSTKHQLAGIVIIWCWVFTLYYCYKFLTYDKDKSITFYAKLNTVYNYFLGTIKGIILSVTGNANSYLG